LAQAARDSNGDETAWRSEALPHADVRQWRRQTRQKHDQDLRDTCVMLLDRAGCDLLMTCDITGHSYRSAQTIVKHYRARKAAQAESGIDWLELQVRKEGLNLDRHSVGVFQRCMAPAKAFGYARSRA
jgi:hypothetical protein